MVKEHEIFKKTGKNGQLTFENIFSLKTTEKKNTKFLKFRNISLFILQFGKKVLKFEHSWYWEAREKKTVLWVGGNLPLFKKRCGIL